jgi:hypothetical protein
MYSSNKSIPNNKVKKSFLLLYNALSFRPSEVRFHISKLTIITHHATHKSKRLETQSCEKNSLSSPVSSNALSFRPYEVRFHIPKLTIITHHATHK